MAISKDRKAEIMATYAEWVKKSQSFILVEYTGAKMKDLDTVRNKVRETGGEFHIVKNTLIRRALKDSGMQVPETGTTQSTAISFAFADPAATAKALSDATKNMAFVKVKAGMLGTQLLDAAGVKALAELPPLPVVRAQLLGVLQAPAAKLVRTLAEPARGVAAAVRAYSEKAPAAS